MRKSLNIDQVCRASRLSRATVYRWADAGMIPKPRKKGGAALWEVKSLREALARKGRLLLA